MAKKPKIIRPSWVPERVPFGRRVKTNQKFYNSRAWRKTRKVFLERNPLCVKCQEKNITQSGQFVDHIQRIEDGGAPLDLDNLQTLCEFHHNQKSGREAHGYREKK